MTIQISELVKDVTQEALLGDLIEIAKAVGVSQTAMQPGEPLRGVLSIISGKVAVYWNTILAPALRGPFLDHAKGGWLTIEAWSRYNTLRKGSTFAEVPVTLENRQGGFYTFLPGDVRIQNDDGKTFTNVTGGTLVSYGGSGAYPTVTLTFRADEAGAESSTAAGDFAEDLVLGGAGVFVVGGSADARGQDAESDESLVERARLASGLLSAMGPEAAFLDIAQSTRRDDGTFVDVTRVRLVEEPGLLLVYLATSSGAASGDTATEGSDVYLVNARMQWLLGGTGVDIIVDAARAKAITYAIELKIRRGANLTNADAVKAAKTALTTHFSDPKTMPIGGLRASPGGPGYVFASELGAVASEAATGIFRAVVDPPGDTGLDPDEVAVPDLTITATQVTQ